MIRSTTVSRILLCGDWVLFRTSGGLLFCVPADRCDEACEAALGAGAPCAAVIGEVRPGVADGPVLLFS